MTEQQYALWMQDGHGGRPPVWPVVSRNAGYTLYGPPTAEQLEYELVRLYRVELDLHHRCPACGTLLVDTPAHCAVPKGMELRHCPNVFCAGNEGVYPTERPMWAVSRDGKLSEVERPIMWALLAEQVQRRQVTQYKRPLRGGRLAPELPIWLHWWWDPEHTHQGGNESHGASSGS